MNLEKLSTKDWKSSRLCLNNYTHKPKSKEKVIAICHKCRNSINIIFIELIRSVNRQSKYTEYYHCKKCLVQLPQYTQLLSQKSKDALPQITKGASDRSIKLWQNNEYRDKIQAKLNLLSKSDQFKEKVSLSIKEKFKDITYRNKIKKARKLYWTNTYRESKILTVDEYIQKVNSIHNDTYDYSKVVYTNIRSKIIISCKLHGDFEQRASHHLYYRNGCPKCAYENVSSNAEYDIGEYIKSCGFDIIRNHRILDNQAEIDIFIPTINVGIEYNGDYWHSYASPESAFEKYKHKWKFDNANKHNILLLQFFESEWLYKNDIVKSIINSKLRITNKIMARKCRIKSLTSTEADMFINNTHIQGKRTAQYNYGLFYNDELVACLTLSDHKQFEYEIIRYSSKLNTTVVGGLSKLLKYFIISKKPNYIMTYSDCRYSIGNAYSKTGFKFLIHTKPGYFYTKNHKIYNRIKFQKHKLSKILPNYDSGLTESENMFNNGYRRIWNAGNYKFVWSAK